MTDANMFVVSFYEGRIDIPEESEAIADSIGKAWPGIRDSYLRWVGGLHKEVVDGMPISERLQWKGYCTWWTNKILQKNSFLTNQWMYRILLVDMAYKYGDQLTIFTDDKVLASQIKENKYGTNVKLTRSVKNVMKDALRPLGRIIRQIYRKLIVISVVRETYNNYATYLNKDNVVWFRTLFPVNWNDTGDGFSRERLFEYSPYTDKEFSRESVFVAFHSEVNTKDLLGAAELVKEVRRFRGTVPRKVIFPEGLLGYWDLLEIYWTSFIEQLYFINIAKNDEFKKLFTINDIPLARVLLAEWRDTYWGVQQAAKIQALAIEKLYENSPRRQIMITYMELFQANRIAYQAFAKGHPGNISVTIQHAMNSRNKTFTVHSEDEFSDHWKDPSNSGSFSPMPDFFFVHGRQYRDLLSQFYPSERIKVIGSLKTISCSSVHRQQPLTSRGLICPSDERRRMLISPTMGGEYKDLFRFLAKVPGLDEWCLLLAVHPAEDMNTVLSYVADEYPGLSVHGDPELSSMQLLPEVDILLTGNSTISIEARVCDVPTVRIAVPGKVPQYDEDPRIPTFSTPNELSVYLGGYKSNTENMTDTNRQIINDYFFKNDGRTSERLWSGILEVAE